MRGVSAPPQANVLLAQEALRGQAPTEAVRAAKKSTRAYNRVVLRLRAQAELIPPDRERVGRRERSEGGHGPPPSWSAGGRAAGGRSQSRAPSPTNSAWGGHSTSGHGRRPSQGGSTPPQVPVVNTTNALYRPRRAPLLRVFVPANGDWLDDQGVLEAEGELRKAGIAPFLRSGDVVWDTALGDEGNTGRMLWDGRYLIDLDYTYTPLGDVPGSLPSLAFAPSFWHRVVRTAGDRGPVVHVDVKPWAEEIAGNLQLLQDRVRTETPQGNYHTVVRWVHRSSFTIRNSHAPHAPTLILPGRVNAPIDQGWYGTVVLEAEGTNEGLADLQQRCRGGFPPNAAPGHALRRGEREFRVWRILRERSRPGEIWIRAVSYKERLLP
ncbi:hypothetical protein PENSPDRAFT_581794 [Peniophora sp. CONT]|nr:hypothetical protein PENSPDRAFT_581794 [Peniophora sp. CONT]